MIQISEGVLAGFLAKSSTEIGEALKVAIEAEDQKQIDAVITGLLETKVGDVKATAKQEGKDWGKKEALKEKQIEIANSYDVDGGGMMEDVLKRILAKEGKELKTIDTKTIRESEVYKNDLKALQDANKQLEIDKKEIENKAQKSTLEGKVREYALQGIDKKKIKSEKQKEFYVKALLEAAEWKLVDGEAKPFDKDGFPIKDNMQNEMKGLDIAKRYADDFFDDADPKKEDLPDFGDKKKGEKGKFEKPDFGGDAEKEAVWFESLSAKDKEAFAASLE